MFKRLYLSFQETPVVAAKGGRKKAAAKGAVVPSVVAKKKKVKLFTNNNIHIPVIYFRFWVFRHLEVFGVKSVLSIFPGSSRCGG